jgi:protein-disulfide isomerase
MLHGLLLTTTAQWLVPPPLGYDGYRFGSCDAPAKLEMFVDLLCGSCKAAFPTIEELVAEYGSDKLELTLHTIPAPWHTWAFHTAQSLHVVASSNRSAVLPWLRLVFLNQDHYENDGLYTTAAEVISSLDGLAAASGILPKGAMVKGMGNSTLNFATRISWKYTVSRGVSGTPGFLLNGVPVIDEDVDGGAWNATQWKTFIDPVLKPLEAPPPPRTTAAKPSCALPCGTTCCRDAEFCLSDKGCRAI